MKKEHKPGIAVIGFIVLVTGIVTGCGKATPTGNTSPIASASALAPTVASPTATRAATKAKPKPRRTAAPTKSKAPAPPPPTTAPAAAPTTPSGCYPISDEGTCYEPGEYCRDDDHGATGVAGDGEAIICEDNDGWRWEPA